MKAKLLYERMHTGKDWSGVSNTFFYCVDMETLM